MNRTGDRLQNLVIGTAVVLAVIVAFFVARNWIERWTTTPAPAVPAGADPQIPSETPPGASASGEVPTSLPTMLLKRARPPKGMSGSKAPPPPPVGKSGDRDR